MIIHDNSRIEEATETRFFSWFQFQGSSALEIDPRIRAQLQALRLGGLQEQV